MKQESSFTPGRLQLAFVSIAVLCVGAVDPFVQAGAAEPAVYYGAGPADQVASYGMTVCVVSGTAPGGLEKAIYTLPETPHEPGNTGVMTSLIRGADGELYGVSAGTLFQLTTAGAPTTSDHSTGGGLPRPSIPGAGGDRYGAMGTTLSSYRQPSYPTRDSAFGYSSDGTFTSLYSFALWNPAEPLTAPDVAIPGKLIEGGDDDLYGAALDDGAVSSLLGVTIE